MTDDDDSILSEDFALSSTFTFGDTGVRVAGIVGNELVIGDQLGRMASFDWTARNVTVLPPHSHAVTAMVTIGDLYVTGCKDNSIRIFSSSHALVKMLTGHTKPVTSLAVVRSSTSSQPFLISGSWDESARIWDIEKYCLVATLPGHENSVCVTSLPPPVSTDGSGLGTTVRVATGSAGIAQNGTIRNHSVRLWSIHLQTGQVNLDQHINEDHEGPIRSLCTFVDPGTSATFLVSCSNDGTVKVRDSTSGLPVSTLSFAQDQHPPMLLSVVALHCNETILVTGSESGTVAVFNLRKPTSQPQIIPHASCVWNIVPLPSGDFGTCCQDGTFYVFTRTPSRMADDATRATWEDSVRSTRHTTQSGPSNEEIAKLPCWHESLKIRGRSDGQVQLFQKDGIAIAAQWNVASQTWIEVGQVIGNPESNKGDGSASNMIEGVRYDYVFPIQVDTSSHGTVTLQIGYNKGENPFVAAQRFIDAHVLPQFHLADIADYVTQQSGGVTNRTSGDPVNSFLTGGGSTDTTHAAPISLFTYLPGKSFLVFELNGKTGAATMEKIKSKIESFGGLSNNQLVTMANLVSTLLATSRYHSSRVLDVELDLISFMLRTFSASQCFPVLDLARIIVLHPDAASSTRSTFWSNIFQQTAKIYSAENDNLDSTSQVAIPMLFLRLLANAFKGGPGSLCGVVSHIDDLILPLLQTEINSSNKNIRLSAATLLHNLCYYFYSTPVPATVLPLIVSLCHQILSTQVYEGESVFRTLVAVGTLLLSSINGAGAKEAAKNFHIATQLEMIANPHSLPIKAVAKEVSNVLLSN